MPAITAAGAQGTGLMQPPIVMLNTANAVTTKYIMPILGDTVLIPSPTFWALTRRGKKFAGGELVYPILTQEEMTGGAYQGDQVLEMGVTDSVSPADQVWRFYRQSITIPLTDVILNRGGYGALDLIRMKYQIMAGSFMMKLCRALWHASPQNTSIDLDDLDSWIGGTANVIAGIDRSQTANSWWLPAANVLIGGVLNAVPATSEAGYQTVVYGYDEPDTLILDPAHFATFKSTFTNLIRFTDDFQDKEALQVGFRYHFIWNNATVLSDKILDSGSTLPLSNGLYAVPTSGYLLNSNYIFPVFHEADYFVVDPFIKPSNQRVISSTCYVTMQVCCPSPRMHVKFTGLA
jgi:hypothetical protein